MRPSTNITSAATPFDTERLLMRVRCRPVLAGDWRRPPVYARALWLVAGAKLGNPQTCPRGPAACAVRARVGCEDVSRSSVQIHAAPFYTGQLGKIERSVSFYLAPCEKSERGAMAYVINEPCIGVKDSSCVEVCPVDCIHPTPEEPEFEAADQLYIDPEECIDCDACVEACPVDAITPEDMVPPDWHPYIELNAAYYRRQRA
jgi:NAD-dependent dihydropyrimidine dehydrogenase PreA subunit